MVSINARLNKFNLSHGVKGSCDMGKLYPVAYIECVPNDWFKIQQEYLIRFMATLAPVMHLFKIRFRWYYTPFRILMEKDDWQNFITGGEDGLDNTVLPWISSGANGFAKGSLADYLGMPVGVPNMKVSAFPFRAYAMIYNEIYRNQVLQQKVPLSLASGQDTTTNTDILKRCWQRDYFTNQLPAPQKGPAVTVPLGTSAPVIPDYDNDPSGLGIVTMCDRADHTKAGYLKNQVDANPTLIGVTNVASGMVNPLVWLKTGMKTDLSQATAASINTLRQAFAVQRFQENAMRSGSRYVEYVLSTYGIRTPDASLQRPQYVGGCTSPMVISEVLQTSETTNDSAQGNMAGHGVGAGTSPVIKYHSLENGCLMCLMSIMPTTDYYQGLRRDFQRQTRYDFLQPLLAHLGEQGTKNSEIFAQGSSVVDADGNVVDDQIFGYTPRYQEYRSIPNMVVGEMRDTLEYWQDGRKFSQLPTLSAQFVESTPSTRIFAVEQNTDHLVFQVAHHIKALRPLPKYGVPGLIDH